jgi:hypothetical protein
MSLGLYRALRFCAFKMRALKFGVFCVREILLRAARFSKIYGIRFCRKLCIYAGRKEKYDR